MAIFSSSLQPYDSRMYTLVVKGYEKAIMIDSIEDNALAEYLASEGITSIIIVLTHEHCDHILGIKFWRERFICHVLCTEKAAVAIPNPKLNRSKYDALLVSAMHIEDTKKKSPIPFNLSHQADESFSDRYELTLFYNHLWLIAVEGHSKGGLIAVLDDLAIFTGDSLIPDVATVLCLSGGNAEAYEKEVKPLILGLPPQIYVYPGHGDGAKLDEILKHHPDYIKITGATK